MDWIQSIKSNENEALKKLYATYKQDTVIWVQKEFQCSFEEAMDIFQTTVVIFYDNVITEKLTKLSSDIKTYLFGIARNKAYELMRSKKKEADLNIKDLWVSFVAEEHPTFEEENVKLASFVMDLLGKPCSTLLQLFYYEQKNMEEITHRLGYKNVDSTKNQKYKCLKRLQSLFFQHKQERQRIEK